LLVRAEWLRPAEHYTRAEVAAAVGRLLADTARLRSCLHEL
jgi:hypothetical protein